MFASLRWATLSLRRSFFADGIRGLHASLGIQLVHLSAHAEGFLFNDRREILLPAAAANLEWRQPIAAGLFLLARLTVHARMWPQTFSVDGVTLMQVPPWGVGLEGGVGWNFL